MALVNNIHVGLPLPEGTSPENVVLVVGDYDYFHYCCDDQNDKGWGCGYRTLQSMCSWVYYNKKIQNVNAKNVPSLQTIQEILVSIGDKPKSFLHSKDWIGSVEVGLVIDVHYDVPCKILHISHGSDIKAHLEELEEHFKKKGSPIMMGGDSDAASKGIFGVCHNSENSYLLVVDPHYYGASPTKELLYERDMLLWKNVDSFMETSFYNLCLPQMISSKLL